MKLKTRSLRANLLIYFLIFSALILGFLYFFQILFLNTYYKINQSNNLDSTIKTIENNYEKENASDIFNEIALNNEVCIQIIKNGKLVYYSDYYKHCVSSNNNVLNSIEKTFINSTKENFKFEFINTRYNNKSLVYGKKIDDSLYVFANTTLEPIDSSINLLKSQFVYVAILVLFLSLLISYYFSKRLASPIIKMNTSAKKLAKKEYNVTFSCETEVKELKELSDTLNKAAKELGKTEELQREFLANVGHDLKTPLTMIEAYAASARDLNYNKKAKRERDLNIIIDEAERLNMLVNDILLLSKMQSKTIAINKEKFNITDLITEILERFKIYENDGYNFEFKKDINYFIEADKKQIERVIYNLIINAINYVGTDKTIKIILKQENNLLSVMIKDNGLGIKDEDKKLVWNKYYRTNKKHRRNNLGTGLGLSIVKEILEVHNFDYGVDSEYKKGSSFYFKCEIKESKSIMKKM